jgi:hypothetical protein
VKPVRAFVGDGGGSVRNFVEERRMDRVQVAPQPEQRPASLGKLFALLQWRPVAAAHICTEPHTVVSSLQPDRPKHPPEYAKEY